MAIGRETHRYFIVSGYRDGIEVGHLCTLSYPRGLPGYVRSG